MTDIKRIKNLYHQEKKNLHQISKEVPCSWATAKNYVEKGPIEISQMGQRPKRISKIINDVLIKRIQELLNMEKERKIHRKQRYTAKSLYLKMKEEKLFNGCERYFRKIMLKQRKLLNQMKKTHESHLELNFTFGKYLQIDHGPVEIELDGHRGDAYLFCASVPGYCLRFCQIYKTKGQESWGYFHEKVFKFFGGIFENCIYDNDSVLKNPKTKEITLFSSELIEHYGIKLIFCNVGKGNEKGAVENSVGTCRRLFLSGMPSFKNLEETNAILAKKVNEHTKNENHYRTQVPLQDYQENIKEVLLPLKDDYEWGVWVDLKVDSLQRVRYKHQYYSVPERYVGATLKVYITPLEVKIFHCGELVAAHERCFVKGKDAFELDHYLDQLERKPRAINFSKVMQQENFPEHIKELRDRLRIRFELDRANIELIRILKLKRFCNETDFETGIRLGLSYGGITFQAIKLFIEQLQLNQTQYRLENLPDKIPTNMEVEFDLTPYAELTKRGETLC